MHTPLEFYNNQLEVYKLQSKKLFKTLTILSIVRLIVFLGTGFGVYATLNNTAITISIGILGVTLFLVLLRYYTSLKEKRELCKRLIIINNTEIDCINGNYDTLPTGNEFKDPKHFFSLDIDIFGKGSFFQYINRTATTQGKTVLAKLLVSNCIANITNKQTAIKELANLPKWRQHYTGIAKGITSDNNTDFITKWMFNYATFLKPWQYYVAIVYSFTSLVFISLAILKYLSLAVVGYWLVLGLILTGFFLKKINYLAQHTSNAKAVFRQYALLLKTIESTKFNSEVLLQKQQQIKTESLKASQIMQQFSKALDALDNRNNLISAIFGNGFFLYDIRKAYTIELWIQKHNTKVADWFEVVSFFDAYNSLANLTYNHPEFTFPTITNTSTTLDVKQLGHPLLKAEKRIDSDVLIQHNDFFIITGANMAGKSTFLRTVALHIVMANMGLPVCASKSHYTPVRLITSMRTTDSLTDNSSYFFSELTRLKFVVDTVTKQSNYFIILDEILKGTNSTDKALGSKKFVEKLVQLKSTGIIATHDLSLTEIAQQLAPVKNYFFDAQIKQDELFFDYTLKQGVCKTMNASFLLQKMEII